MKDQATSLYQHFPTLQNHQPRAQNHLITGRVTSGNLFNQKNQIYLFLFLCVLVYLDTYICTEFVPVPTEAWRRVLQPLEIGVIDGCELGTEPGNSGRAVSVVNH